MRPDLADRLRRLMIALAMKELILRRHHACGNAGPPRKHPCKIDGDEPIAQAGMVRMMSVFLRGRILLGIDDPPRQGTLKRTVAHGDLRAMAAGKVAPRAAHALGRGTAALIERQPFSGNRHGFLHPSVQAAHLCSPFVATTRDRSCAARWSCGSASALSRATKARAQWRAQ